MTITVRRLLALADWAGNVEVTGGRGGLDRAVRRVHPILDLGARHEIVDGELAVLVEPVAVADWRVDALLRRIADAGGAGLLLIGGPLAASCLLADRLRVPLLSTPAEPLALLVSARLLLAAPDLDRAELVLATHAELDDRLRAPEEIVGVLRGLLRASVALLDDRGTPVAGDPLDAGPVRVDEPVPQRCAWAGWELLAHPVLLPRSARPALWLVAGIRGDGAAWADTVAPALAIAASAAARWLLVHRVESERDARYRTALLGDVLRVAGEPSADLRRRAADAGWRLGGWHVGIRIGVPPSTDVLAREPDVVRVLRGAGVDAVVVGHGDGWTGWATFDVEPSAERVRATAAGLRDAHRELRRTLTAHLGVGRPRPSHEGLARTVAEAADAATLAATRPESGYFLHVDQLGMAQLLLEWTRTDTFEPAARTLLAPLQEETGDLVRTLSAYLDAESSLAAAAAVLGVHRNTVAARVARIERLLQIDLARADDRLALQLACRAVTLSDDQGRPGAPAHGWPPAGGPW
ncbi:PucR family transcriptional regulator [Pseudonocardia spinosispora]|uniref:PucR family transcriptional regulator n=1 Tax=Pseudonocardia spinosispora TaxID=103441 RepID=UPI00040467AE|nr:helix-turn-helix domain-containing protein [Pseudonocardia spinosispora]